MRHAPATIDMSVVRALHANGLNLKSIAAALGIRYHKLAVLTAKAGLAFRNNPRRRILGSKCVNGHLLTEETSRLIERKGKTYRMCMACATRRSVPKAGDQPAATTHSDTERTRRILDLCIVREHAPHWEKPLLTRQIEELRA